jgi:hypothetical protein
MTFSDIHPQKANGKGKALVRKEPSELTVYEDDATEHRTRFTSWKLDILNHLSSDPALSHADVRVAYYVMRCVDERTWAHGRAIAYVAIETICEMCCISKRHALRATKRLWQAGWLTTQKTRLANRYVFNDRNLNHHVTGRP